ncbi:MAG: hypothetical protein WCB02_34785, partial [Bradyrhizobium sp.]
MASLSSSPTLRQRFDAWRADNPDETILRWIFRGIVTITVVVLAGDLAGMNGWVIAPGATAAPDEIRQETMASPGFLPSILAPLLPDGDKRVLPLPQPDGVLAQAMT